MANQNEQNDQTGLPTPNTPKIGLKELARIARESSERYEIVEKNIDLRYHGVGEQREVHSPQRKKKVSKEELRSAIIEWANEAGEDSLKQVYDAYVSTTDAKSAAIAASEQRDKDAAPLWQDRETVFEELEQRLNPVEWIKKFYGRWSDDGSWDSAGLSRADLKVDPKLYDAYASWIRPGRHPEDDLQLPLKAVEPVRSLADMRRRKKAANKAQYQKKKLDR